MAPANEFISLINFYSIVTFTGAYVSYVTPKTDYDSSTKSYYVTITVCLIVPKPTTIDVAVVTRLSGTLIPPIQKVMHS